MSEQHTKFKGIVLTNQTVLVTESGAALGLVDQVMELKQFSPPLDALIGIADLQAVADLSSNVVQKVRAAMLAPTASKTPPVFSTSELSDLCGIEKSHVLYHAKKGTLPPGVKKGSRLEWTLEEAKEWVEDENIK